MADIYDSNDGLPGQGTALAPAPLPPPRDDLDPASRSLADALRVSFRVLSVVMVLLVSLFLLSGIFTVKAGERAVVLRFGRVVGSTDLPRTGRVLTEGLHFGWPYPVDHVIRVPTTEQEMEIRTFWFRSRPGDHGREIGSLLQGQEGLAPGLDGALMTGDNGLVHVKWRCTYRVPQDEASVLAYVHSAQDVRGLLRAAIENASIKVASRSEVDAIWRNDVNAFIAAVRHEAQQTLDAFRTGVQLMNLTVPAPGLTPPPQTVNAFNRVQKAEQEAEQIINEAQKDATATLTGTATNWRRVKEAIDEYDQALRDHGPDSDLAAGRYAAIGELLEAPEMSGQAKEAILAAFSYQTEVREKSQQYARQFTELLADYRANPDFFISRHWAKTKQEILAGNRITKEWVPANMRYVLFFNPDPRIVEAIRKLEFEEAEAQLQEQRARAVREAQRSR